MYVKYVSNVKIEKVLKKKNIKIRTVKYKLQKCNNV